MGVLRRESWGRSPDEGVLGESSGEGVLGQEFWGGSSGVGVLWWESWGRRPGAGVLGPLAYLAHFRIHSLMILISNL